MPPPPFFGEVQGGYPGRAAMRHEPRRDFDRDDRHDRCDRRRDHDDRRPRRSRSRSRRRRRSHSRDDPHARVLASTLRRLARHKSEGRDDRAVQLVMNFGALQLQDQTGLVRGDGLFTTGDVLGDAAARRRYSAGGLAGVRGLDLAVPSWGPSVSGLLEPGSGLGRYGYSGIEALGYAGLGHQGYRQLGDASGLAAYDGLRRGTDLGLHMTGMVNMCRQCGVRRSVAGCAGNCRECVFENGLREREQEIHRERLLERAENRGLLLGYGPPRRAIGYGRA